MNTITLKSIFLALTFSLYVQATIDIQKLFDQSEILQEKKFQHALTLDAIGSRNPALLKLVKTINEQSENQLIITPQENPATPEDLNNALLQDFRAKKARAIISSGNNEVWNRLAQIGLTSLTSLASVKLANYVENHIGNRDATYARTTAYTELIKQAPVHLVLLGFTLYNSYGTKFTDPLQDIEELYVQDKRLLSPALQRTVEKRLALAHANPAYTESTIQFCNIVLNLPKKSKLAGLKAPIDPSIMHKTYTEGLDPYEPHLADQLTEIMTYATLRSYLHPRSVNCFEGPPGTGKSNAARNVARGMGVPCVVVSASSANTVDLIGDATHPGKILEALMAAQKNLPPGQKLPKDLVIVFEDVDQILKKADDPNKDHDPILITLLQFAEPTTQKINLPYIQDDLDISEFCTIFTCNNPLGNEALKSRVNHVKFGALTPELKKKIVYETILPTACLGSGLTPADLTPEELNVINNLIQTDKDPGIRTLQLNMAREIIKLRAKRPMGQKITAMVKQEFAGNSVDSHDNEIEVTEK